MLIISRIWVTVTGLSANDRFEATSKVYKSFVILSVDDEYD
jgi:hypothetical protein